MIATVSAATNTTTTTLWLGTAEDMMLAVRNLSSIFRLGIPGDEKEAHHIIAFKSELYIKKLARKIMAAGGKFIRVYQCEPLAYSFLTMGKDVAMMIELEAIPYEEWLESRKSEPLDLEEAVAIAEDIIAHEPPSTARTISLDLLGRRARVSEFHWNKNYLDVIRAKLENAFELSTTTIAIDQLIAQGTSGSTLAKQINEIAADSPFPVNEVWKLYYERLKESELECDRSSNRNEIDNLLNLTDQSLDLADYLPPRLARSITQWCSWLNIRPAVSMTALLAGASSLHKAGTELVLQRSQNFRVPSTIYAALVSPSGQKKSPVFNNIIRNPLNNLEKEKLEAYQAAMQDYEAALERWEKNKDGQKPKKPKDPTLYYFTNATGESIPVQAAKDPQKALLALIDELSGYFNSSNAYRNGRGSDKQDLLSYFDAMGQTVLRAGGVRVNVKNIYLSIFGTIQPEVLKRHMEDCSDPDGNWARFLFVNQPLQAAVLHNDEGVMVQISDRLTNLYRRIDQLPEMEYYLSPQAFKRYQEIYNQLERLRVTHSKSGMAAVYSKMEGYIGRLALNLHVLWELDAGKACPDPEIPLWIIEKAIELAKFYIGQIKLIYAHCDEQSLPTHIVKLIELSKRLESNGKNGWIKAQQYREQFAAKKRPSAQQARDWMKESVNLGYGCTRNDGNRLEFHWKRDNNGNDTPPLPPDDSGMRQKGSGITSPKIETLVNEEIENNLGNLGEDILSSSLANCDQSDLGVNNQDSSREGGCFSDPSLVAPLTSSDVDLVGDTTLEENPGNDSPESSLDNLVVCQSADEDITVSAVAGTLNEEAEIKKFLKLELVEIAVHWLVERLHQLQEAMEQEQINAAVEELTSEEQTRIKRMEAAVQYVGEDDAEGIVDGKLRQILKGQWVEIITEERDRPDAWAYVKKLGSDWQEGIPVSWQMLQGDRQSRGG